MESGSPFATSVENPGAHAKNYNPTRISPPRYPGRGWMYRLEISFKNPQPEVMSRKYSNAPKNCLEYALKAMQENHEKS